MSALPAEAGDDGYVDATPSRTVATTVAPAARPAVARVRRPGLVVVPAVRRSSAPLAPFVAVVTALLVLGLAALLALNTVLAQDAFRIHDLEQANARLAEREQALGRQLDTVESPATLAERAEELGMVPSRSPLFLRLPDGAVLGAAPADGDGSADPDALVAVEAAGEAAGVAADAGDGESGPADSDSDSDESGSQESGSGTPEESASGSSSGSEAGDGSGSVSGDSGTSASGESPSSTSPSSTSSSGTSSSGTSAGSASGGSESEEDTP